MASATILSSKMYAGSWATSPALVTARVFGGVRAGRAFVTDLLLGRGRVRTLRFLRGRQGSTRLPCWSIPVDGGVDRSLLYCFSADIDFMSAHADPCGFCLPVSPVLHRVS